MKSKEIRKLAIELQACQDTEIIKISSILGKLKRIWKSFTDSEYRSAVKQVQQESESIRGIVVELSRYVSFLDKAIKDGEADSYRENLPKVKELMRSFWTELSKFEKDSETVWYFTENEIAEPGFIDKFKKYLPESYNIELGKLYNKPLKSFSWYSDITPDIIEFNKDTPTFNILLKKIINIFSKNHTEEQVNKFQDGVKIQDAFKDYLAYATKDGIINGLLIHSSYRKPYGVMQHVPAGQTTLFVMTSPIMIPANSIDNDFENFSVQVQIQLIDKRTSAVPINKLTVQNILTIEKTAFGIEYIIKNASVNFNSYKFLSDDFWKEFVNVSKNIGANPFDLAQVIYTESAFDPQAINYKSGKPIAKGLNQLVRSTALAIGMTESEWDNYENIPAIEQLKYVQQYFSKIGKQKNLSEWNSATQLYVGNFAPGYLGKELNENTVLYSKVTPKGNLNKAYLFNSALDKDKKGFITAGDLHSFVNKPLPQEIKNKISQFYNGQQYSSPDSSNNFQELDNLISALFAGNDSKLLNIIKESKIKQSLPIQNILLKSKSKIPQSIKLQSANAIKNIIKSSICGDVNILSNGSDIDIQFNIPGNKKNVELFIRSITEIVDNELYRRAGIKNNFVMLPNILSEFDEVSENDLINNRRKFALSVIGAKRGSC